MNAPEEVEVQTRWITRKSDGELFVAADDVLTLLRDTGYERLAEEFAAVVASERAAVVRGGTHE